ncbi:MAG: DNA alkylation repair protein [Bacilli bacterium]|nr:DNA alkylation repair protein [Bacilli bacterium]
MNKLQNELLKISDKEYAAFQSKLTPGVDPELFLGVRVPLLRQFAKSYGKSDESKSFVNELPHKYYDENMLHALLISQMKDFDEIVACLDKFLPYVDNWAVCDIMSPKRLAKNKDRLLENIKKWTKSKHTYTCRFGIEMLMSFYLDDDFKPEYLKLVADVHSDEYYVNMMSAWFFATALAKQWDATIPYVEKGLLDTWVNNKTIQKAIESYRISDDQKLYLRGFKRQ